MVGFKLFQLLGFIILIILNDKVTFSLAAFALDEMTSWKAPSQILLQMNSLTQLILQCAHPHNNPGKNDNYWMLL